MDLYIADLTDPTLQSKKIDLNGAESGNGIFEIDESTFDIGASETEATILSEDGIDDDVQAGQRLPRTQMSFRMRMVPGGNTYVPMQDAVHDLNRELLRKGAIVIQPTPDVPQTFVDYLPSPLVGNFRGESRGLLKVLTLLQDPDGLPVKIWRRSKMRRVMLDASVNRLGNALMLDDPASIGRPGGYAWDSLVGISLEEIDWRLGAYTFVAATGAARTLKRTVTPDPAIALGETWVVAFDAAGTNAGGAGQPKARAALEWLDGVGVQIGATVLGPLQSLSVPDRWTRCSVSAMAPAGAVSVRMGLVMANGNATPVQIWFARDQVELGPAPTDFTTPMQTLVADPTAEGGYRFFSYSPTNVESKTQFRAAPDAASSLAGLWFGRRSGFRNSSEFAAKHLGRLIKDLSLFNGTAPAADAGANTGTAAKTTFADQIMRRRWRVDDPATDPTSTQGRYRLFFLLRLETGHSYKVQGKVGFGNVDDLRLPLPATPITLDLTDSAITDSVYVILPIGLYTVPAGSSGIYLEGWAQQVDGVGAAIYWNSYVNLPADEGVGFVSLPGAFQPIISGTNRWDENTDFVSPPFAGGSEPAGFPVGLTAGAVAGGEWVLNDINDAVAVSPVSGFVFTDPVKHTLTVSGIYFNPDLTHQKKAELRVFDVTSGLQVAAASIYGAKGVKWGPYVVSTSFTPNPGDAYVYYVVRTGGTGNVHVPLLVESFVPAVQGSTGDTIALDGDTRRAYTLSGGEFKAPLLLDPPFLEVAPEHQLHVVLFGENPPNGYDAIDVRGPLMKFDPARTLKAGPNLIPMVTSI